MAIGKDSLEIQKILSYNFSDVSLLDSALTHSSYTYEMKTKGIKATSNERLEFLGDAVLELVISEHLYSSFLNYREGALTKMRQILVCEKTLAEIAEEINLGDYLNLGNGEENSECRKRPKVLADALEALIGAMYIDCLSIGKSSYRDIILKLFEKHIEASANKRNDFKTLLQQLAEQDGTAILEYKLVCEEGPEHDKSFTVAAYINNNEVGRGVAKTKKNAEMEAARVALKLFGVTV